MMKKKKTVAIDFYQYFVSTLSAAQADIEELLFINLALFYEIQAASVLDE